MDAEIIQGLDCVRGRQKIKESKGLIERMKRETWDEVSSIKIHADDNENKRRMKEDKEGTTDTNRSATKPSRVLRRTRPLRSSGTICWNSRTTRSYTKKS